VRSEVIFDEEDPDQTPTDAESDFEQARPLAEEIIDTLIDLLFFSEFTLPKAPPGKNKVTYAIWQSGVGCNTPVASTKEFENNRVEILRLLLTFASKSMYMSASTQVLPLLLKVSLTQARCAPCERSEGYYVHGYLLRQAGGAVGSLLAPEYCRFVVPTSVTARSIIIDAQVQPCLLACAI
jgi:hypothetical protein